MKKATEAMLIYALTKDWDTVIGLTEQSLIKIATNYYMAGSVDNETKQTIDDIYLAIC